MLMYFFVLRPQAKKSRDLATLIQNLKKGDEVVTAGGLIGKVAGIADSFVTLDVSQNTTLKILKSSITGLTDAAAANAAATVATKKTK
jgi:preprotein translocase subunit YajC